MRIAGSSATVRPSTRAQGRITIPGDKSISHRYAMLAALADGVSSIRGYSRGMDCLATLACISALGASVDHQLDRVVIEGCGLNGFTPPSAPLDAANSGTTMRLMAGILAAQPFTTTIVGDGSLSRRPMRRVIVPLTTMGARIDSTDGHAPLTIHGGPLRGISHQPDVPSAQIKSAVLLAGLHANGATSIEERVPTRDHTERAFETFHVSVHRHGNSVAVRGGERPVAQQLVVPGDISGAAFWCALAAATPAGDITIEEVGLNPTRMAFLDLLQQAGANVTITYDSTPHIEPSGSLRIRHKALRSFAIAPQQVAGVIDEIPALAALAATMPEGCTLEVRGAKELRVKESDRISMLAAGFRAMGSDVDEYDDGFTLRARPLRGAHDVYAAGDHRLAMAFMIAATKASAPVTIHDVAVEVSYPGFAETLAVLTNESAAAG